MQRISLKKLIAWTVFITKEFEIKDCIKENRPVAYANAKEILEAVIKARKFSGSNCIKIMANGGQGSFKICDSIFPDNYFSDEDEAMNEEPLQKKRKLRRDSNNNETASDSFKFTGVKRILMLCIAPNMKETYKNVKILFELIKLNEINSFKFVGDFKVILMINGQQTASASFPCPYRFMNLRDLKPCGRNFERLDEESLKLKTFGNLRADFKNYSESGREKKLAKELHSTINEPLFSDDDQVKVISKCIITELHLLQGYVNHLFWDGLVYFVGLEKALRGPSHE